MKGARDAWTQTDVSAANNDRFFYHVEMNQQYFHIALRVADAINASLNAPFIFAGTKRSLMLPFMLASSHDMADSGIDILVFILKSPQMPDIDR